MATPTTLPASFTAGQVLTAAQMNNLRGGFRILQVVQGTLSTAQFSSSSTYADTGLTVTITPQSTTSKIFVAISGNGQKSATNASNALNLKLVRGATDLTTKTYLGYTATALAVTSSFSIFYLDSPATIAATTYKLQYANLFNGAAAGISVDNNLSTITVFEVSA